MKTKQIIMPFLSGIILLTGCGSSDYEDKIVGKYYSIDYTADIEWDEEYPISMTDEIYEEFFPDNTSIESGMLKFSLRKDVGKSIILKYECVPDTLEWKIKDRKIHYVDQGIPDFKIKFKGSNATRDSERLLVSKYRSIIENDFVDAVKQHLLEHGNPSDSIIQLNDKYLVTEDKEGERTICKRIIDKK
jgi:hypothetical protein